MFLSRPKTNHSATEICSDLVTIYVPNLLQQCEHAFTAPSMKCFFSLSNKERKKERTQNSFVSKLIDRPNLCTEREESVSYFSAEDENIHVALMLRIDQNMLVRQVTEVLHDLNNIHAVMFCECTV